MNLVKIGCSFRAKESSFFISIHTSPDCKETKESYVWEGKRISKSKINTIQSITYNKTLDYIYFYVLSLNNEIDIEMNKNKLKEYMIKHISEMIENNKRLNESAFNAISKQSWEEKYSRYDD